MTWKPSADMDEQVREWMKAGGWDVTRTAYNFDKGVYAWRHELCGGKSPTLPISQEVLEHYPGFAVVAHLDRLKVASAIRARPEAYLLVLQLGQQVVVEER